MNLWELFWRVSLIMLACLGIALGTALVCVGAFMVSILAGVAVSIAAFMAVILFVCTLALKVA